MTFSKAARAAPAIAERDPHVEQFPDRLNETPTTASQTTQAGDDTPGEFAFQPLANIFPMLDPKALAELADDIAAQGLREPIILLDDKILDGRNRYLACQMAGVEPHFEQFGDSADPLAAVISLNLKRRHLDESQRAMIAAKLATLRDGQRQVGQLADVPTQERTAQMLNVGERSVRRAREVLGEGAPELVAAVEQGKVAVSAAAGIVTLPKPEQVEIVARGEKEILAAAKKIKATQAADKATARGEKEKALCAKITAMPGALYGVIYADPPTRFEVYSRDTGMDRAADNHYSTMTDEELMAMQPPPAAADSVCFLWSTVPKLAFSLVLMAHWQFEFKSQCVWAKDRIGTGHWFRNKHEILLVGTRGKVPAPSPGTQFESVIIAPVGEHSAKPAIFREMIERYFPTLPKLELFARGPAAPGWSVWGKEAEQ